MMRLSFAVTISAPTVRSAWRRRTGRCRSHAPRTALRRRGTPVRISAPRIAVGQEHHAGNGSVGGEAVAFVGAQDRRIGDDRAASPSSARNRRTSGSSADGIGTPDAMSVSTTQMGESNSHSSYGRSPSAAVTRVCDHRVSSDDRALIFRSRPAVTSGLRSATYAVAQRNEFDEEMSADRPLPPRCR